MKHQGSQNGPAQTQTHDHGEMMMGDMMHQQFESSLWTQFAIMALGGWLALAPMTFGYGGAMAWNDMVAGAVLFVLAVLSISYERGWARWANTVVGIWLLMAPLVFWAPTAAAYINSTLIGMLAIAFSILVPGMPGMRMLPGPETPQGWSYNPSSWLQRAPVIALGIAGFLVSRYLAAFQLGYIDHAWDPFFGDQTVQVLTSDVSRAWPVSDAGLGAVAYTLEALSGFMGHRDRWRTMPWMVLMFGFLVIPLGLVHIVLVISQPVVVGQWCTLCLVVALLMLIMIPLAVDEVVAMGQFMAKVRRQGKPFWTNFWHGGTPLPEEELHQGHQHQHHADSNQSNKPTFHSHLRVIARAMIWGVTAPWNLLASTALGIWLMASPGVLLYNGTVADSDHLAGPLVAVIAVIALAEVVRPLRYLNILLGAWIIATPWLLSGATTSSTINNAIIGVALIALSVPLGPITQRYGDWNARIR